MVDFETLTLCISQIQFLFLQGLCYRVLLQVIPGNLPKYASTNHSLLQCKTCRPISVIICWLIVYQTLFKSKVNGSSTFTRAQNTTLDVCDLSNRKFQISKPFYIFKWTIRKGRQSLVGTPRTSSHLVAPGKRFDSQPSSIFKLILLPRPCCYGLDVTWNWFIRTLRVGAINFQYFWMLISFLFTEVSSLRTGRAFSCTS